VISNGISQLEVWPPLACLNQYLIVDDERGIRETLSAVLRDEGFTADAVGTGEECLKAITRRAYGCVLLDVWLPGINGLETLSQMRESNCERRGP